MSILSFVIFVYFGISFCIFDIMGKLSCRNYEISSFFWNLKCLWVWMWMLVLLKLIVCFEWLKKKKKLMFFENKF